MVSASPFQRAETSDSEVAEEIEDVSSSCNVFEEEVKNEEEVEDDEEEDQAEEDEEVPAA